MKELCTKLLKILRVELEDLQDDVDLLEDFYAEREKNGEVSHYVLLENRGLLETEKAGFRHLIESLEGMKVSGCSTPDELVSELEKGLKTANTRAGYPNVVFEFARKRLQKVYKYIQEV